MPPEEETNTSSSSTVDIEGSASIGTDDSVSVGLSMETDTPPANPSVDWGAVIPKDLQEKEHFKNILAAKDPAAELVKQLDNAQKLIGKKTGLPGEGASDEEWEAYFQTTRPKAESEYELKPPQLEGDSEQLANYLKEFRSDERLNEVRKIFHKAGLTKKQAEYVASQYETLNIKEIKGYLDQQTEMDNHFDKIAQDAFGGDKMKAIEYGKQFINRFASEKTKQYAQGLPNEALVLLADIGQNFHAKYEKQDSVDLGSAGGDWTIDSVTREMHRLMASEEYRQSTMSGHSSTLSRVQELAKIKANLERKP